MLEDAANAAEPVRRSRHKRKHSSSADAVDSTDVLKSRPSEVRCLRSRDKKRQRPSASLAAVDNTNDVDDNILRSDDDDDEPHVLTRRKCRKSCR